MEDSGVSLTHRQTLKLIYLLGYLGEYVPSGDKFPLIREDFEELYSALGIENPLQYWRWKSPVGMNNGGV